MEDDWVPFLIGFVIGLFIFMTFSIFFPEMTPEYKHGQIDAANGKMLFELKKQENGSTVWVRK